MILRSVLLSSVLLLSACGTCKHHCVMGIGPGDKLFDAYGDRYDNMDPCQYKGKPEGYKLADFCFANRGKKVYHVKDNVGKIIYKIQ